MPDAARKKSITEIFQSQSHEADYYRLRLAYPVPDSVIIFAMHPAPPGARQALTRSHSAPNASAAQAQG